MQMNVNELLERALKFEFLSIEEGVFLYENAATAELMFVANELKKIQKKKNTAIASLDKITEFNFIKMEVMKFF